MAAVRALVARQPDSTTFVHPLMLGRTALHCAAAAGTTAAVTALLECGADPTARDTKKQTAYDVSRDKDTRMAFRRSARAPAQHLDQRRIVARGQTL